MFTALAIWAAASQATVWTKPVEIGPTAGIGYPVNPLKNDNCRHAKQSIEMLNLKENKTPHLQFWISASCQYEDKNSRPTLRVQLQFNTKMLKINADTWHGSQSIILLKSRDSFQIGLIRKIFMPDKKEFLDVNNRNKAYTVRFEYDEQRVNLLSLILGVNEQEATVSIVVSD